MQAGPRWSDDLLRIGEAVNQMARAQETSVAALRQVSLDIAHDLKTPIQRVSVHLDDLARAELEGGDRTEPLARARAELDGVGAIFQALLQLAQVERGDARAHFAPVDLTALCRTMAELFDPAATDQGKALACDLPAETITVSGDRTLIGQMLANLIENALRHSGDAAQVTIALRRAGEEVQLSVSDDGPGIPAADRGRVLQRLYRLDRSRGTPGHGLGLALVDGVAKLHSARLELADNAPGLRVAVTFMEQTN